VESIHQGFTFEDVPEELRFPLLQRERSSTRSRPRRAGILRTEVEPPALHHRALSPDVMANLLEPTFPDEKWGSFLNVKIKN